MSRPNSNNQVSYNQKYITEYTNYIDSLRKIAENQTSESPNAGDLFLYLNLSILSGEYFFEKYDESKIKNKIVISEFFRKQLDSQKQKQLITVNNCLQLYNDFHEKINDNLRKLSKENFSEIDSINLPKDKLNKILLEGYGAFKASTNEDQLIDLCIINIFIAFYDENLESDEWCLSDLKEISDFLSKHEVNNQPPNIIANILLDKTLYLIFKIRYRKDKKKQLRTTNNTVYNCISGNSLDKKHEHYINPSNYYFQFYKKTVNHYSKALFSENQYLKDHETHFNGGISQLDISNFFGLNKCIKYSEKINNSKKNEILQGILLQLEKKLIEQKEKTGTEFEIISLNSAVNLLKNTKLKLFLDDTFQIPEPSKITKEYLKDTEANFKKIEKFLTDINFKKYFDYKKYDSIVTKLDNFINDLILKSADVFIFDDNSDNKTKDIESLKSSKKANEELKSVFIEALKLIHEKYEEYLDSFVEWDLDSKELGLLPIYLEEKECLTNNFEIKVKPNSEDEAAKIFNIKLFLDSSYILPVDFSSLSVRQKEEELFIPHKISLLNAKIETLYYAARNKLSNDITQLIIDDSQEKLKSTTKELADNNNTLIDELKDDLKKNEFRVIQIVAMFVTIASFILIQVKIYDNKNGYESIAITFALGGVLVLFNAFFHMILDDGRRGKIEIKRHEKKEEKISSWESFLNTLLMPTKKWIMVTAFILLVISICMFIFKPDQMLDKTALKVKSLQNDSLVKASNYNYHEEILKKDIENNAKIDSLAKRLEKVDAKNKSQEKN